MAHFFSKKRGTFDLSSVGHLILEGHFHFLLCCFCECMFIEVLLWKQDTFG